MLSVCPSENGYSVICASVRPWAERNSVHSKQNSANINSQVNSLMSSQIVLTATPPFRKTDKIRYERKKLSAQ